MRLIVLILLFLHNSFSLFSQTNNEESRSYNLSAKVGVGITKFAVSGFDTEDYPAMATRIGAVISKNIIGNRFQVESGMNVYFRGKSKSPLVDEIFWYGKGARLPPLDETATQRHIAFEIPIMIKYLWSGSRSMNTGLIIRQWGPKDHKSFLASQTEVGAIIGINQKVIKHFSIGLDFYLGFKDFFSGGAISSSGGISIRERSALFSIAYDF